MSSAAQSLGFLARRALRAGPRAVLRRLMQEVKGEVDRVTVRRQVERLTSQALLARLGASDLTELWCWLGSRPYPALTDRVSLDQYESVCPGDAERILEVAERAVRHEVDLLGSGPIQLGARIDWHRDYKTGARWPPAYIRRIDYRQRGQPSDVKFPWELSRLQWLIPVGQAYLLTGDERYSALVRDVIADWIAQNPYAWSVSWRIAMEPAMRILTWTWFFHVFRASRAWSDGAFRAQFLRSLFLHADFVYRHLEFSDVNGNHLIADAAALVVASLFFGRGRDAGRWMRRGWSLLTEELPRQIYPDGVDFEGSIPYHRFVLELLFLPARYREIAGLPVPETYRDRLIRMARFTAAYTRPDGTAPVWGDADDGRALPFGGQDINDHRYLLRLVGEQYQVEDLLQAAAGSQAEAFWIFGPKIRLRPVPGPTAAARLRSQAFNDAGYYILRNERDHVFVDCGPVGMNGKGGHGHNDCLSLDAVLDGVHLIADCGCYLYTASWEERNRFRSTRSHNTPLVDGAEINRLHPDYLWSLQYDAVPTVHAWSCDASADLLVASHRGYERLASPVTPRRTVRLDHASHTLTICDELQRRGEHTVEIPLHLAPGVEVECPSPTKWLRLIAAGGKEFMLTWDGSEDWMVDIEDGGLAPSYGRLYPIKRLAFRRKGPLPTSLIVTLQPV